MNHLLKYCLVYLFLINIYSINAQDAYNPWGVSLGINGINNPTLISDKDDNIVRFKTWNQDAAGFRISGARYLKKGFLFQTDISLNTIKDNNSESDEEFPYVSIDGLFKYNINTSSTELSIFDPYLCLGGGYTWLDEIGAGTANAGIGFNIWVSNHFGFNIQSTYKLAFKEYGLEHFQHSAGIVFKFGGADADNDGINDKDDNCPNLFGLIQFNGCPDTDGDGIEESKDECPLLAGPVSLNGCPDTDNDGVADKLDKCPEVYGAVKNSGCPWQDNDKDGVLDKDDECPNEIGPVNNNGCPYPELPETKENIIEQYPSIILFDLGKSNLNQESKSILNNAVSVMKKYPSEKFRIDGHSDNTFTKAFNLTLSQERANNVRNYLISNGIDASRLSAKGFGEDKPIASNNTLKGRQENSRVEITLVK